MLQEYARQGRQDFAYARLIIGGSLDERDRKRGGVRAERDGCGAAGRAAAEDNDITRFQLPAP
jgi:hypothetical protein